MALWIRPRPAHRERRRHRPAATLVPTDGRWEVREGGPVRLWERIERVLSAYDDAGRPGPQTFTMHV
ncbi:hypothetical protein TPA0909_07390 [Streptomyces albus]|nr:hypothetical protein TPA0909_07390 [Streptomyces albus]